MSGAEGLGGEGLRREDLSTVLHYLEGYYTEDSYKLPSEEHSERTRDNNYKTRGETAAASNWKHFPSASIYVLK